MVRNQASVSAPRFDEDSKDFARDKILIPQFGYVPECTRAIMDSNSKRLVKNPSPVKVMSGLTQWTSLWNSTSALSVKQ